MRNSAVQPSESTTVATSQTPFHEPSSLPSLLIDEVALHAVRIHGELEAAALVVVRVDQELDLVGRAAHVATRQRVHDAVRMRIEHADEDVEILLVERDLELGLVATDRRPRAARTAGSR